MKFTKSALGVKKEGKFTAFSACDMEATNHCSIP